MDDENNFSGDGLSFINDVLIHFGTPRHSGRYPWGSGDSPYQHTGDFYTHVNSLKDKGMTETQIAEAEGLSTTQLRALYAIDKDHRRADMVAYAKSAVKDGKNNIQIGIELGEKYNNGEDIGESTVRSLLNGDSEARMNIARKTANNLKKLADIMTSINIGSAEALFKDLNK